MPAPPDSVTAAPQTAASRWFSWLTPPRPKHRTAKQSPEQPSLRSSAFRCCGFGAECAAATVLQALIEAQAAGSLEQGPASALAAAVRGASPGLSSHSGVGRDAPDRPASGGGSSAGGAFSSGALAEPSAARGAAPSGLPPGARDAATRPQRSASLQV